MADDAKHPDNIIFDITVNKVGVGGIGISTGGFGHPTCINYITNPEILPPVQKP